MIELLADATTQSTGQSGGGAVYQFLHNPFGFPLLLLLAVIYMMLILPKRKQDRQRQNMLGTMKRGDRIQTIGGVLGSVVEPREDRVLVKVDESSNTKIWFARSAIAKVLDDDGKAAVK